MNLYGFIQNNSVNNVDILGLVKASISLQYGVMKQIQTSRAYGNREDYVTRIPDWKFTINLESKKIEQDTGYISFLGSGGNINDFTIQKNNGAWYSPNRKLENVNGDVSSGLNIDKGPRDRVWKKYGLSVTHPESDVLGEKGVNGKCVQCIVYQPDFIVNAIFERFSSPEKFILGFLASKIPDPSGLTPKLTEYLIGRTTRFDRYRISLYLIICADGKKSVGILNVPKPHVSKSTTVRGITMDDIIGSKISSDPGGNSGQKPYDNPFWIKYN